MQRQMFHPNLEEINESIRVLGDVGSLQLPRDRHKLFGSLRKIVSNGQELRWQLLNFQHLLEEHETAALGKGLEKIKELLLREAVVSSMSPKMASNAALSLGYLAASHPQARKADESIETLAKMLEHKDGNVLINTAYAIELIAHSHHKNLKTNRRVIRRLKELAEGNFELPRIDHPTMPDQVKEHAREALLELFKEPKERERPR